MTTRVLPVPVTMMSTSPITDSSRATWKPSIAACSAQIGSTSPTIDARALAAQRLGRALAHVAVAGDEDDLAADQHVGRAVEPVGQRVADAVGVVELRLRHRVVDVDRGEEELLRRPRARTAGGRRWSSPR